MTVYRLLLIAVALCARVAAGEEPAEFATIPYRHICAQRGPEVGDAAPSDRTVYSYSLQSSLADVAPKDIKLQLRSGATTRDVIVDENGCFTLVYDQALYDADAVLVTNQPKGSIRLRLTVNVNSSDLMVSLNGLLSDGRISYAKLYRAAMDKRKGAAGVAWATRLEQSKAGSTTNLARTDKTLLAGQETMVLLLWPSGEATAASARLEKNPSSVYSAIFSETYPDQFSSMTGEPLLRKAKSGTYGMYCTSELLARNPNVVLSTEHKWTCALLTLKDLQAFAARRKRDRLSLTDASQ